MASYVSIINGALDLLSKQNISAIDEQSTEASKAKLAYTKVRDELLQSYPWRFARKIAVLPALVDDDDLNRTVRWAATYARPNDCLKIRRIIPEIEVDNDYASVPYEEAEGKIYCDLSPATLEYTARKLDPSNWPPLFCLAYEHALAGRLCMPLTKNIKLYQQHLQLARNQFIVATTADANEEYNTTDVASSTYAARGGSPNWDALNQQRLDITNG